MTAARHPTAWDDPGTRRAWMKLMACAVACQILWPAACMGLLAWYVIMSITWTLWLFFVPMLYSFYRAFLQPRYIIGAFRTRRLLRHYPWQVHETPESGVGDIPGVRAGYAWLKFSDPEALGQLVTMVMHSHVRSVWWGGRLGRRATPERKAQVREIWFAGDPRFAAVIAAPGPCRLYVMHQRSSYNWAIPAEANGASPQALERARRAGVHVPDPHSEVSGTPGR